MAERKQEVPETFLIEVRAVVDRDGVRYLHDVFPVQEKNELWVSDRYERRFNKRFVGRIYIPEESFNLRRPVLKARMWQTCRGTKKDIQFKINELETEMHREIVKHYGELRQNLDKIFKGIIYSVGNDFTKILQQ